MKTKIDMTYSFLWDTEPTDEQLLTIMQEVADDVRVNKEKVSQMVIENIKKESISVLSVSSLKASVLKNKKE